MKRPPALSLLLVFLLAACQLVPPPIVPPSQTEVPQTEVAQSQQPQEEAPKLMDQELGQKLQAALEAAVDSPDTIWPGAILHVSSPALGEWSGAAGLGDVATNTPMQPHDRFRAGSLTKPFIATVILQLVEEGRFALDDPITTVLPDPIAAKIANSDKITIRMLLNHTSGVADFMDLAGPAIIGNLGKVWDAEEFIDFAAAEKPRFAPGEAQYYSNTGYLLLGMIIEKATGRPWRQELRERIFEPLKLEETSLPEPAETAIAGDHAHGYADFGNGVVDATELATASVVGAAGGQSLVTTAPDLARFLDALLAGRLFQKSESLDEMLTMVPFAQEHPLGVVVKEYGLGLNKAVLGDGITAIGHSGDTEGGYSSFVYHFPEQDVTISGAVNMMDPAAPYAQLMPRVLELLVPGYTMADLPVAQQPNVAADLQGLLDSQVDEQGILGMVMAVRLPDGTVIGGASGSTDPAGTNAWGPATLSAVGSVTKSYVAVVIMQLVEEGKLSLDDTIDRWFPDQPNGDMITVRMLLSHTSGLANYISGENVMDAKWVQEWAPADLVAEANKLGPVAEPGTSVAHYANTNYILLALIIQQISGNSWIEEVQSRIIEPLQLQQTTFISAEGVWGGRLVAGYFRNADGYTSTLELPSYPHVSTSWAAGEIASSAADLLTFASALFDGKLVSKETLAEMATPLAKDDESGILWGLGGGTTESLPPGAFGMGGDIPGYHAFFAGIQGSKLVVVALTNTEEGDVIGPSLMALSYLSELPPRD